MLLTKIGLILSLLLAPSSVKATDGTSTTTPHWSCVRFHESRNGLNPNIYQFQNPGLERSIGMTKPPALYTRQQQDHYALAAYALARRVFGDGWQPWDADKAVCNLP